jgi:hypothetical protein
LKSYFWWGIPFTYIQKIPSGGVLVICSISLTLLCPSSLLVVHPAERYTDVLKFLDDIIAENGSLHLEARNLFFVPCETLAGSCRNACRTVNAFFEDASIKEIPELAELRTL